MLVKLDNHIVYPEVVEERETPQHVFSSLELSRGIKQLHIVHSSPARTHEMAELMKTVWNNSHPTSPAEQIMNFTFHLNVDDLMDVYYRSGVDVSAAIVLSEKDALSYTIRISPDSKQGPPSPSNKKVGLETCRGLDKLSAELEAPIECPVNGYYYSNFLAIQHLVDHSLIMVLLPDPLIILCCVVTRI